MKIKKKSPIKGILIILLIFFLIPSLFAKNKPIGPIEINFESNGNKIHGWFYEAQGKEFIPTSILLHGFPGRDSLIYQLGQSLAKNGVVYFFGRVIVTLVP